MALLAQDKVLFGRASLDLIYKAVCDFSWLLSRRYPQEAALKLVGDRYQLQKRQRTAVLRSSCSDINRDRRGAKQIPIASLAGRSLVIDGLNCIIAVETAIKGALVLRGRDGALRDLASVHGSYRCAEVTETALHALERILQHTKPSSVRWFLDRPVSNSGKLAQMIRELNESHQVDVVFNPDKALVTDPDWIVASSDAWVLDQCTSWVDLTGEAIASACVPWCLDVTKQA